MIDNFYVGYSIIESTWESSDDFWVIEVIKRRKDNPEMTNTQKLIRTYHVRDSKELLNVEESIRGTCLLNNARAYFRVNKRSWNKVGLNIIEYVCGLMKSGQLDSLPNVFDKIAGQVNSGTKYFWILDWDDKKELLDEILEKFPQIVVDFSVKTVNGWHYIIKPCDIRGLQMYISKLSEVIHKDNGTLLWCDLKES